MSYAKHQSIGYALECAVRYFGHDWADKRTLVWTTDGYKLLMTGPAK